MGILLGDVSGKGFPAALHMARLMSDFRHSVPNHTANRQRVLNGNQQDTCMNGPAGNTMFTTALFLSLDLKNDVVCAANAGHPPLIVCPRGKRK